MAILHTAQAIMGQTGWKSRGRRVLTTSLVVASTLWLTGGCTSMQTGGGQLRINQADACAGDRASFAGSRTFYTDHIIGGAVSGGVMGAAGGALVSYLAGGNAGTGALMGLGIGAVSGASASYYSAMAQKFRDQQTLAMNINSDLAREGDEIDHVTATFARVRACRFEQARQTKAMMASGQITRDAGVAQLSYQKSLFDEEIALARQYGLNMQKRDQEFQVAAVSLERRSASESQMAAEPESAPETQSGRPAARSHAHQVVVAATRTIPEKQQAFALAVSDAETRSKEAFNPDSGALASAG